MVLKRFLFHRMLYIWYWMYSGTSNDGLQRPNSKHSEFRISCWTVSKYQPGSCVRCYSKFELPLPCDNCPGYLLTWEDVEFLTASRLCGPLKQTVILERCIGTWLIDQWIIHRLPGSRRRLLGVEVNGHLHCTYGFILTVGGVFSRTIVWM